MTSYPKIKYRKRLELGMIGALVICQIVFFVIRKFEFVPEIKEEPTSKQAGFVVINPVPPPPPPKSPPEPPPPPEPMPPQKTLLPKRGPIKPIEGLTKKLQFQPLPAPPDFEQKPFIVLDKEPKLIVLKLNYPDWARRREIYGKVGVEVLIDMNGRVTDAKVVEPSGYQILDEAAIAAAKNSIWEPALQNDRPVSVWVKIPIKFELHR